MFGFKGCERMLGRRSARKHNTASRIETRALSQIDSRVVLVSALSPRSQVRRRRGPSQRAVTEGKWPPCQPISIRLNAVDTGGSVPPLQRTGNRKESGEGRFWALVHRRARAHVERGLSTPQPRMCAAVAVNATRVYRVPGGRRHPGHHRVLTIWPSILASSTSAV